MIKIGDKVNVLGSSYLELEGTTGEVTNVVETYDDCVYIVDVGIDNKVISLMFMSDEIELYEKETIEKDSMKIIPVDFLEAFNSFNCDWNDVICVLEKEIHYFNTDEPEEIYFSELLIGKGEWYIIEK